MKLIKITSLRHGESNYCISQCVRVLKSNSLKNEAGHGWIAKFLALVIRICRSLPKATFWATDCNLFFNLPYMKQQSKFSPAPYERAQMEGELGA